MLLLERFRRPRPAPAVPAPTTSDLRQLAEARIANEVAAKEAHRAELARAASDAALADRTDRADRAQCARQLWGAERDRLRARLDQANASLRDSKVALDVALDDDDHGAARDAVVDALVFERAVARAEAALEEHKRTEPRGWS